MGVDYTPHPAVLQYAALVDGLARAIGPDCEIVLHDLRHPSSSLVHIAGSLTSREIGAPITNIVLEALRRSGDEAPDIFNYRTVAPNGHTLRSSTLFIRARGRIVGALCLNMDVTPYEDLSQVASRALAFEDGAGAEERFENTVGDVLDDLISAVFREQAVQATPRLTADERLRVVSALDERGVFLIKGAVEMVARRLGVSKFTVYGYLQQVRAIKGLGGGDQATANRLPALARLEGKE